MRLETATDYIEIELEDRELSIRTGRLGTRGATRTIQAHSEIGAIESFEAAVIDATSNGFQRRPGTPPDVTFPPDSPIERALRIDRGDRDARAVFADWLQGQGNPAGEWIALALQRGAKRDPKLEKRLAKLEAALRLPLADQVKLRWQLGMWTSIRIENAHDRRDGSTTKSEPFRAAELARQLFAHPLCAALDELAIGAINYQHNQTMVRSVLAEAASHAWARELPSLIIGDCRADPDFVYYMTAYNAGPIGKAISRLSGLRKLRVWRNLDHGATTELAGVALPQLEDLAICGQIMRTQLAELDGLDLPNLERLELWIGGDPGNHVRASDIPAILSGARFPKLRHLALKNSRRTNDLASDVASSPLGKQLESLDISMGTLDDEGARRLVLRARMPLLKALAVDRNMLQSLAPLRAVFPFATGDRQRYGYPNPALMGRGRRAVGR